MNRIRALSVLIGCVAITNFATRSHVDAQEQRRPRDAAIAPFLNDQTLAVAAIDLASPDIAAILNDFWWRVLMRNSSHRETAQAMRNVLATVVPGIPHPPKEGDLHPVDEVTQAYLVVICPDVLRFFSRPRRQDDRDLDESLFLVIPGAKHETIQALCKIMPEPQKNETTTVWACREINRCAVIAEGRLLKQLAAPATVPRPEFEEALASVGGQPVRIAVAPPPLFARAATEILQSPAPGTDQPLGQYLADVRFLAVGMNPAANSPQLRLLMKLAPGADPDRMLDFIARMAPVINGLLTNMASKPSDRENPAIGLPPVKIEGDRILWTLDGLIQFPVAQLAEASIVASDLAADRNRLKRIVLALHTYHDAQRRFPDVAIRDKEGKPLLSWRVAILPYIDQNNLYKEFHLDEPWDSKHNRKLIDRMPDEFRSTGTPQDRTRFLAPVGETLAFTPGSNAPIAKPASVTVPTGTILPSMLQPGGLNMKTFTDGTLKTILVVEVDADHAVVWTKPEELVVDLENPKRGITDGEAEFQAVFVDGVARRFKGSIRPEILRAMFTRNGGEIYDIDNIYPAP